MMLLLCLPTAMQLTATTHHSTTANTNTIHDDTMYSSGLGLMSDELLMMIDLLILVCRGHCVLFCRFLTFIPPYRYGIEKTTIDV